MTDDFELLRAYVERQSEAAFTELVERHKGLVYASAWRQTGDAGLAEEITQAVFIVLARKARAIQPGTILSGWLFRATRFAAADALKRERRRVRRESEAMNLSDENTPPGEAELAWREIAPLLDESLARLGETDRNALLLRFFDRKSLIEVGVALGVSEEASRKRVQRALEKLRLLLTQRGVVVPVAMLATTLAANAAPAAPVTVTVSMLAAAGSSTTPLVKGILTFMAWSKAKIALVTGAALLVVGGGVVVTFTAIQHFRNPPRQVVGVPPSPAPVLEVPDEMTMTIFQEPAPDADGFISLFNGKDLTGWNYNPHVWSATNGVIVGRVAAHLPRMLHYLAWAGDEVDDFELRLSFRVSGIRNSGVPIRARWAQQRWFPGYQVEIHHKYTGLLLIAGAGRERLLSRQGFRTIAAEENGKSFLRELEQVATSDQIASVLDAQQKGEWCHLTIIAQGRHFITRVNGVTIIDTRDEHSTKFVPRGMIGLEYTHLQDTDDTVEFKDIRLKRLPAEPAQ